MKNSVKTMTCTQLGGPCNAKITGSTPEETLKNAMAHLEKSHPDMAAQVKATPENDPTMVTWREKFMKDWSMAN